MKKIVITGASGFVAGHFIDYLYNNHIECEILGLDIITPKVNFDQYSNLLKIHFSLIDLINQNDVKNVLKSFNPDYILHLAAISSVAYSWKYPSKIFLNNNAIFLNLLDSILDINPSCRIVIVGSSEEYGDVDKTELPIMETRTPNPISPYAISKFSQELMSKIYLKTHNLNLIFTRSFNHIGPRQDNRFVIPSFIQRIVDIKKEGLSEGIIETGDTTIIRDFIDVRDAAKAYHLLLAKGTPGEIYNICSGNAYKLSNLIDFIANEVGVKIITKINPKFIRPTDNKALVGSNIKIATELNWKPIIDIKDTIKDMIAERL